MQQRYPCPRCGAPVDYGSRFCNNCGNTLQASAPSQPPPPPGPQYPNQPQPWGPQPQSYQPQLWGQQQPQSYNQQSGWNQSPPYNQVPGRGGPPPVSQQNINAQRGPMLQRKIFSGNLIYLVIVCVVVVAIGGIALATNGRFFASSEPVSETPTSIAPETPVETPPATTPEPEPEPVPQTPKYPASQFTPITATELITAYASDSNVAIGQYQGKEYAISGTISEANSSSPPFIYMKDSAAGTLEIQCNFSQGQEANISALNIGDKVKVDGQIGTFTGTIIIINTCKLVQ
jgi:hypothetical protein